MADNRPENSELLWKIQKRLKALGYDIGTTGPNGDGVDGDLGPRTYWDESRTLRAIGQLVEIDKVVVEPPLPRVKSGSGKRVYLDIGHGQKPDRYDSGAVHASSGTTEHALNEVAAHACADVLRKADFTVTVDDSSRHNYSAGKAAGGNDIFVSFHHNAAGRPAQGSEALYHVTKGDANDVHLAQLISAELSSVLGIANRGAKPMALSVVSGAEDVGVPAAVLAECYFIHDQAAQNPLASNMPSWSKRAGEAVARAILSFAGQS